MSLGSAVAFFLVCAAVIAVGGVRLARVVDEVADRTGVGEAVAGAVLLGFATSLSGSVLSISSGISGNADLALSNAMGGIAVQTVFLVVADLSYRRANLEHAAASVGNMLQGALLIALLSLLLLAFVLPEWTIGHVHVITPVLLFSYIFGIRLVHSATTHPMWGPRRTPETREDVAGEDSGQRSLRSLLGAFVVLALVIATTGWMPETSSTIIAEESGLGTTVIGTLFTATVTSLPELVTTLAAIRAGALTLAVSGIIGGNAFDTLFAAFTDVAYREGSVYHAVSTPVVFWTVLSALMTAVLLMGLLSRQERGPGRIGFESVTLLGLYGLGVGILLATL